MTVKLSYVFVLTRLPLLLSINCGTFGVEAEDRVLTTDSRAQGIESFEVVDMPTHEGLFIQGGSDMFFGEMRVTGWFSPGADHDVLENLALTFDHHDNILAPIARFHSSEVENVTVRQVVFDVQRDLDVVVDSPDGGVSVAEIDGTVNIWASYDDVRVEAVTGSVTILDAGSTYVKDVGPVRIEAQGDVRGAIDRGGSVDAGIGDIDIAVPGDDFERLSLTSSKGAIDIDLSSGGWTLDIDAGYPQGEGEHAEAGHVVIDIGDVYINREGVVQEVFTVNGGGPRIAVRDAHEVDIR